MKRQLNKRLFLCLVAILVVLGPSTYFLHAFQLKRCASFLQLQAGMAKKEGDVAKAASYFNRYLTLDPTNVDALAEYGQLLENEKLATTPKGLKAAFFVYEKVLRLDSQRHDLRRRAIQLAMHPWIERFSDAKYHIDTLFAADVKDAELLSWYARCCMVAGEFKKARSSFEEAIHQPKNEAEHFVGLAYLLREHADKVKDKVEWPAEETDAHVWQTADEMIEKMLATFKDSYRACLLSAGYYERFAADKAEERRARDIAKALDIAPNEADVLLAAADLELHQQKAAAARDYLAQGVKLWPKDWRLYDALSYVEISDNQPTAAVKALQQGLAELPKQVELLWSLANLYLRQGKDEEAKVQISGLKETLPQRWLDFLQGRLLVNKEEWSKAIALLERTYPQLLRDGDQAKYRFALSLPQDCKFLLASCFEGLRDPDRAAAAYDQILSKDPKSAAGRLGLARMQWAQGRLDIALREYMKLMQSPQSPTQAWVECAELLVHRNLKSTQPNWAEVDKLLDLASQLKPMPAKAAVQLALLRAEVLAAQKEFIKACDFLNKQYPDVKKRPVEVWVGLSVLEERQGKTDEALAKLDEAEAQLGDSLELRVGQVRYWARKGGAEAASALSNLNQDVNKWPLPDQRRLEEVLAQAYLSIGNTKYAEAQWRKIAKQRPTDVGSRLMLFDLALQSEDETLTGRLVADLKEIEGDEGTLWQFCKACRLIWQAKNKVDQGKKQEIKSLLDEANGLLAVVAGRRGKWYRVPMAQGLLNELLDKHQAALDKYRESIALGNQDPALIRRLVILLSSRGNYQEADDLLQTLKVQTGSLSDLTRIKAEVALAKQDFGLALSLAQKAVSPESTEYRDHIWLGQMYWADGKLEEAKKALLRAKELAPANPQPWVELVQFFLRTGDKEKAKIAVQEARKNIAKDQARLPLAFCYELLGDVKNAKILLDEAVAASPGNVAVLQALALHHLRLNQREEAKRHLDLIIQLNSGSAKEIAETRRALALVIASSGDYQQTKEALKILGILEDGLRPDEAAADANLADERAKVMLLARQSNPRQRRQAITILEKMDRLKALTNDEQFLLAQLYESVNEWPKALAQLLQLLTAIETKLEIPGKATESLEISYKEYLSQICVGLQRHKAAVEAQAWFVKLEKLEPGSWRTLRIKAWLLGKQSRGTEAVAPLLDLAGKKPELVRPIAELLEEINQDKEAETMFRRFVDQSRAKTPESVLVLAGFLGRRDRPDEALAICDKSWHDCKPLAVAEASVMVLYTAKKCTEKDWQRVAGWLVRESDKKPEDTPLLSYLSAVRRLQGDYQGVITLCRRILKLDKTDVWTMNNLAWVLALHDKDGAAALKTIERAIEIRGPEAGLLDTRAVVFIALGKADQAVTDMEQAIGEAPSAGRYFHLARAHVEQNNRSAALAAYQEAKRLGLNESVIDPLERKAYDELRQDLEKARGQLEKG